MIRMFSNFDIDFRDRKLCNCKNVFKSFGRSVPQEGLLQVSRSGVAKQESYTNASNLVHGPEILE